MELGSQEHLLTSFQGDQTLGSQCGFLSNPLSEFSLIVTILIIKISGLDGIQDGPWAEQRMSKHTFNDTLWLIRGGAAPYNRKKPVISRPGFKSCLQCFVVATVILEPHYPISERRKDVKGACSEVTCVSSPLSPAFF